MKKVNVNSIIIFVSCLLAVIVLQSFQQTQGLTEKCWEKIGTIQADHYPTVIGYCYWNDFYEGDVIFCSTYENMFCQQTSCNLNADPGCHLGDEWRFIF